MTSHATECLQAFPMGNRTHLNRGRKANEPNRRCSDYSIRSQTGARACPEPFWVRSDKDTYLEAKGILERAVAALDDGRDPADNIERIDGQLVEL